MIPLNKPSVKPASPQKNIGEFVKNRFSGYNYKLLYSSRDGLNIVYQNLFERYGALRIAVSPLTCFSALYPIVLNGHTPVYIDIDNNTLNINVEELVRRNDIQGVQLIYLGGNPIDLNTVTDWAKKNNVIIIEDCAQACGSFYNGKPLGTFGSYSVISLVKNLYFYAGGLLLSIDSIPTVTERRIISTATIRYKKIKHFLESNVSYKASIFNFLYYTLMEIKGDSSIPSQTVREFNDKTSRDIIKTFFDFESLEHARLVNASFLLDAVDYSLYDVQSVVNHGQSNRNRIILISKNKTAKEIIFGMRKKKIACNNLTQSYISGYQGHILTDDLLKKYYSEELTNYETYLPYIVAIPNSPFLTKKELEYIVFSINQINK